MEINILILKKIIIFVDVKQNENNVCVKKCTSEFYDEEKNCINECNEYILKEEINFTSHKKCL